MAPCYAGALLLGRLGRWRDEPVESPPVPVPTASRVEEAVIGAP